MAPPEGPPGKPTVEEITADLADEHAALDHIVADLSAHAWSLPTPSTGWSVADQIGHLAYFDRAGALAIREPEAFAAEVALALEAIARGEDPMADVVVQARTLDNVELLASWRHARAELLTAAAGLATGARVPWYGPSMGAVSFLTARLMETWAHGHDVAVAIGVEPVATDRLRHIAQLGVITRRWSYGVRGATAPAETVGARLRAPSGATWVWENEADQWVEGEALDFCLVVTQRRNVADTRLTVQGSAAAEWMRVAQAFAGAPTLGPPPRPRRGI
jgi:uncharacterized protein (TIGR03084 family)